MSSVLPGKLREHRSLGDYGPRGGKESDAPYDQTAAARRTSLSIPLWVDIHVASGSWLLHSVLLCVRGARPFGINVFSGYVEFYEICQSYLILSWN